MLSIWAKLKKRGYDLVDVTEKQPRLKVAMAYSSKSFFESEYSTQAAKCAILYKENSLQNVLWKKFPELFNAKRST